MKKLNNYKNNNLKYISISILIFIALVFSYSFFSKKISISSYDEVYWVGTSYFFQPFIHGNFDERIWDAELAYDEPMLTRFAFGAWLYPKYLKEKKFFCPQFEIPV